MHFYSSLHTFKVFTLCQFSVVLLSFVGAHGAVCVCVCIFAAFEFVDLFESVSFMSLENCFTIIMSNIAFPHS